MNEPWNRILSAVSVLLLFAGPVFAEDRFNSVDPYIKAAMKKWGVPGLAIAVVKDGEVVLVRGYGVCKLGTDKQVNEKTVFGIGSCTKSFTAAAIAILVDEKKLGWDDPVVKHLPGFKLADDYVTQNVTIRDLLCHRTGLERGDLLVRRRDVDRQEILRRMKYLQPLTGFRAKFGYNNLMYVVAGEVAAKASGQTWEGFVQNRIFVPLGMSSSSTTKPRSENRAVSHWRRGGKVMPAEELDWIAAVAPAGSISSNVIDMSRWLKMLLAEGRFGEKRFLRKKSVREMFATHMAIPVRSTDKSNKYLAKFNGSGLGWSTWDYRGRKLVAHAGTSGVQIGMIPEMGLGVVVLSNLDWNGLPGMLMYDVFDAYLVGPKKTWSKEQWPFWLKLEQDPERDRERVIAKLEQTRQKNTTPSLPLAAYAGGFECSLYGKLVIRRNGEKLTLQFGRNPPCVLSHWEQETFLARSPLPFEPWLVTYSTNKDRKVDRLSVKRIGWHEPMPGFRRAKH